MTDRAAAGRYARALFDVSLREADPQGVEAELAAFAGLVTGHAMLWRILQSPGVPTPRKRAVMGDLVARAGLTPALAKLLLLLTDRDRLALLPELLARYSARLMDYLQIVEAQVTTAVPLADDRVRALETGLARVTGKRVSILTQVEPAILGGVVTRIGSTVFDGSIARHLERMKEKLSESRA